MLLTKGKKKCDCQKMATWVYMPGFSGGENPYFCDDCISSEDDFGCSCNWHYGNPQEGLPIDEPEGIEGKDWRCIIREDNGYEDAITKEDGYWEYLDEYGRPYPCVEYEYDEEGFDEYTWLGEKVEDLKWKWFSFKRNISRYFK